MNVHVPVWRWDKFAWVLGPVGQWVRVRGCQIGQAGRAESMKVLTAFPPHLLPTCSLQTASPHPFTMPDLADR